LIFFKFLGECSYRNYDPLNLAVPHDKILDNNGKKMVYNLPSYRRRIISQPVFGNQKYSGYGPGLKILGKSPNHFQ